VPSNDVDDSKVVEDVHVPHNVVSITEDISFGFGTPIFDEAHVSFESTGDDVNDIVEPNTPAVPSKSFGLLCAKYSFMVVPIDSSSSESLEFLAKIQQMVSSAFFFLIVWSLYLSPMYLHLRG